MYNKLIYCLMAIAITTSNAHAGSLKKGIEKSSFEKEFSDLSNKMKSNCGCVPTFEINWDTMSENNDHFIAVRAAKDLSDAFEAICKNADSKPIICSGVKKVVVKKGEPQKPTLSNGILTFQRTQVDSIGIVKDILENNL